MSNSVPPTPIAGVPLIIPATSKETVFERNEIPQVLYVRAFCRFLFCVLLDFIFVRHFFFDRTGGCTAYIGDHVRRYADRVGLRGTAAVVAAL